MKQLLQLDMAKVFPNPGQPRKDFDEFKLNELADKMGITQSWRIDEKISILGLIPFCQDAVKTGLIQTKQAYRMRELNEYNQKTVELAVRSGKISSCRHFNALVKGMLLSQRQQALFELKPMTNE